MITQLKLKPFRGIRSVEFQLDSSVTLSRILLRVQALVGVTLASAGLLAAEPDHAGPRLVSAVVRESGATNYILVTFNERLLYASATNRDNYTITLFGTTNQVPVLGASGSIAEPAVMLRVGPNHWHVGGQTNYYLTVNHVQDTAGNTIAPDSRVGVSWPRYTQVLWRDPVWRYHAAPLSEPDIFHQSWASCGYVEGPRWAEGPGPFCSGGWLPLTSCFCAGTDLGFQGGPALFRTKFVCPPEYATDGLLKLDYLVKEGALFYLNGVEIFRLHLCPPPSQLTSSPPCCVYFPMAPPSCGTLVTTVTNLVAGTNCLAAAVLPCNCLPALWCSSGAIAFDLGFWAGRLVTGPVPAEAPPRLQIALLGTNAVRLWWLGSGYALEAATNLPSGTAAWANSPWREVPDMSNPYTDSLLPHSTRFFRLRK